MSRQQEAAVEPKRRPRVVIIGSGFGGLTAAKKLKHADVHPERLGYCGYVRLFGREYPFTQRAPRRAGFRLVRRGSSS